MSVDYDVFQIGLKNKFSHLEEVYRGTIQEEEQDHAYQVLSIIPVLFKSTISVEMKSLLLAQYTEIKGNLRDSSLANMTRNKFYAFAAERAGQEAKQADQKRAVATRNFKDLTEYMDTTTAEGIRIIETEHELFKSQLSDVIKSTLGIPLDRNVGPREVEEYLALQKSRNV